MDIIGTWKINKILRMGDGSFEWKTREEIEGADPKDADQTFGMMMVFEEGGKVFTVLPIPAGVTQEQIDAAVAAGEIKLFGDGLISAGESEWREVDGKILYKTPHRGEVLGEEANPWVELREADDGFEMMFFRYIRV